MWIMKNKLKLVLWGKGLELPMDYDNLKFDRYELKYDYGHELLIYKNNKMIKEIWYWKNKNKGYEHNYKNGKSDGKQYGWWWGNGKFMYKFNYKNGKFDEKQHGWYENGNKKYEDNYKNGEQDGKQYWWSNNGELYCEENYKNGIEII